MTFEERLRNEVAERRMRCEADEMIMRADRLDDSHGEGRYVGTGPERLGERAGYLLDAANAVREWRCAQL